MSNLKPTGLQCYSDLEYASMDWFIVQAVHKYLLEKCVWRPYFGKSHAVIEFAFANEISKFDLLTGKKCFWDTWKAQKTKMRELGYRVIKQASYWLVYIEYNIFETWLSKHFTDPLIQRGFSYVKGEQVLNDVETKKIKIKF